MPEDRDHSAAFGFGGRNAYEMARHPARTGAEIEASRTVQAAALAQMQRLTEEAKPDA